MLTELRRAFEGLVEGVQGNLNQLRAPKTLPCLLVRDLTTCRRPCPYFNSALMESNHRDGISVRFTLDPEEEPACLNYGRDLQRTSGS